jgi:F420-dependent oxidoreductase-like protein
VGSSLEQMNEQLRFGTMVPQFGNNYRICREVAHTAEVLGYDSLWIADHLFGIPGPGDDPFLECWTLLTAMAVETQRMRLGTMTMCNGFRSPALLAKMAATLDVISGGRLEIGIGSGWYEREFINYGYSFPKASIRAQQLDEAVQILKLMWTEPSVTFTGKHYQLIDARNEPKPLQRPRPPIHIGGDGEKVVLPLVARQADWWNYWLSGTSAEGFRYKIGVLQRCCAEIGRDFHMLRKSVIGPVMLAETQHELNLLIAEAEKTEAHFRLGTGLGLIGTPDTIIQRIEEYRQLGVSLFIVTPFPFTRTSFLELFAEKVIKQVR